MRPLFYKCNEADSLYDRQPFFYCPYGSSGVQYICTCKTKYTTDMNERQSIVLLKLTAAAFFGALTGYVLGLLQVPLLI